MHMKTACFCIVSLVLLCSTGCAPFRRAPDILPLLPNPAEYAQTALSIKEHASQAGIARIAITANNTRQSYKALYAGRHPDAFRLEILGLFNQPALYISANKQTGITLHVPSQGAWYRGPATAESMQRISGIMMDPFDIIRTLHGSPPGPDPTRAAVSCKQDKHNYLCRLEEDGVVQEIWIDPGNGSILRSRLHANNLAVHDINYQNFRSYNGRQLPEKITVLFDLYATGLEITLHDQLTTALNDEQLQLQAPDKTEFLPLSAFFETH